MKNKRRVEQLYFLLAVALSIFLLFACIISVWINHESSRLCLTAQWQYGGDCTEALTSQLHDEAQGFRNRNHAIWALGRLADGRAIPALEQYYTGVIPDREPLDTTISQYELKKAINLVMRRL